MKRACTLFERERRAERRFQRTNDLGNAHLTHLKADQVNAQVKDGILTIVIPKDAHKLKTKKIAVS